jgi:hypothetical protein
MPNNYPSDWDRRRKEVYERDNYTCQNCGVQGGPYGNAELHAHHGVPKSKGGTHRKSNLITYCKQCHDAIHGRRIAPTANSTSTSTGASRSTKEGFAGMLAWFFSYFGLMFLLDPLGNEVLTIGTFVISIIIGVTVWTHYKQKFANE